MCTVGSGFSGLTAAIRLEQRLPEVELDVFEKNHSVGGTWYENAYVPLTFSLADPLMLPTSIDSSGREREADIPFFGTALFRFVLAFWRPQLSRFVLRCEMLVLLLAMTVFARK